MIGLLRKIEMKKKKKEGWRWEVGGFYISARMATQVEAEGVVRR